MDSPNLWPAEPCALNPAHSAVLALSSWSASQTQQPSAHRNFLSTPLTPTSDRPSSFIYRAHVIQRSQAMLEGLVTSGHSVIVEAGAGEGAGISDAHYDQAGAQIVDSPEACISSAELIVAVRIPSISELNLLNHFHVLLCFVHTAHDPNHLRHAISKHVTCIAAEEIKTPNNVHVVSQPLDDVAGMVAVQAGAHYLTRPHGGRGIVLGGISGVDPAEVLILGDGLVAESAASHASAGRAHVTVLGTDSDLTRKIGDYDIGRVEVPYDLFGDVECVA